MHHSLKQRSREKYCMKSSGVLENFLADFMGDSPGGEDWWGKDASYVGNFGEEIMVHEGGG
jgi:hypothetical protein